MKYFNNYIGISTLHVSLKLNSKSKKNITNLPIHQDQEVFLLLEVHRTTKGRHNRTLHD